MEEREKRRADDEKQRYTPKVVFHPVPNSEGVITSPNDKEVPRSYRNPPFRTEESSPHSLQVKSGENSFMRSPEAAITL